MKPFKHPSVDQITLDGVLSALGDPIRLLFVQQLASCPKGTPMNCSKVAERLESVPLSTRHHHMRVLREAGVMHSERRGVEILNTLRKADLESRFPGLLKKILVLAAG